MKHISNFSTAKVSQKAGQMEDYTGRMKSKKTWQSFASGSGAALTTWDWKMVKL